MSTLKPLVLHAHATGPNPYKVAILLFLLSIPHEIQLWEFGDGPRGVKGPAFLAINENGRVPALVDPNTGVTSWESGAVISYILRVYDTKNLYGPRGTSEQDLVDFDKWTLFLLTGLAPMTGQVNWYRHYNATKNEDALERYVKQTYRTYDVLESQLKRSEAQSVLHGGFSAVDVHFYPWVWEYDYAGLSLDGYPMIKKWLAKVGEMKEVSSVYEKLPKM